MLEFATASGQNCVLFLILIAVVVAAFWRAIVKVGIAAIIVGLAFLYVTGLLYVLHGLRALLG